MSKYSIKLLSRAYQNLDDIYQYIAKELGVLQTANKIADSIENAIYSLSEFPYRGTKRRVGAYANQGYRQLFVENFTIVYRVDEEEKQVVVVTIKYAKSNY